jgi:hypothetical protein
VSNEPGTALWLNGCGDWPWVCLARCQAWRIRPLGDFQDDKQRDTPEQTDRKEIATAHAKVLARAERGD